MGAFSQQTLAPCRLVLDDYGRNYSVHEYLVGHALFRRMTDKLLEA